MTPEQAAFLVQQYTQLMQGEFPATCKVLAAVKDDTRDYKPDAKSRSAWELATHLATADVWFLDSIINGKFEWDPEKVKQVEGQFPSVAAIVAFYEKTFPEKLKALRAMAPADLAKTISFFGMMEMPAVSFLGMANNHGIHHRGQLAAYLRAMGSKVPAIYGGSADEPMQGA
ncbi:MAG: DinB family protein [Vicinamibacterales bacterium]